MTFTIAVSRLLFLPWLRINFQTHYHSIMAASEQRSSETSGRGVYKVTIQAYRRKDISEDDFHHHWTNIHAPKVCQHLRKYGVVGYTQYHTPASERCKAAEQVKTLGAFASNNVADFDGYVELRMPALSCYENARRGSSRRHRALVTGLINGAVDPYYERVIQPDEEAFFDLSRSKITVGWEEEYIKSRGGNWSAKGRLHLDDVSDARGMNQDVHN